MIFSSTSVIAEVYAGARSDATAHAAHAGASRFPRAAIGLTWQVLSLASHRAGQARYGLDGGARGDRSHPAPCRGPRVRRWVGRSGMPELLPELMPVGSQRILPARGPGRDGNWPLCLRAATARAARQSP